MRAKFSYWILAFGFMMLLGFQSTAKADDWDQKTTFTINQPVSVPGHVVLPAGSYVIKRVSFVNPVVQILDASESKVYATVLALLTALALYFGPETYQSDITVEAIDK